MGGFFFCFVLEKNGSEFPVLNWSFHDLWIFFSFFCKPFRQA